MLTALVGPVARGQNHFDRLAAGLLRADSGSSPCWVWMQPRIPADPDRISYMPQRFGLYDALP